MKDRNWHKDKNILVVGMGRSGVATLEVLHQLGSKVFIQDEKTFDKLSEDVKSQIEGKYEKGYFGEEIQNLEEFDLTVVSPGVSMDNPIIQKLDDKGISVIGELELAYRLADGKFIGITGTNGKTTTTTLVGEIFKKVKEDVRVAGNIGSPVIKEVLSGDENTIYVTEISSFQLESIDEFRPYVSAILNLTEDHMDRHKTMSGYGEAKAKITKNQGDEDYIVVNFDDKNALGLVKRTRATMVPFSREGDLKFGVFVKINDGREEITIKDEDGNVITVCNIDEVKIPGNHNLENALAATAIAYFGGIGADIIADVLREFDGVEHRLELVDEIDGIKFVNDSKGTNPDAAIKAIEAIKEPIILIAGGYDKNSKFDTFVESFGDKVKSVLLMGATATKLKAEVEKKGYSSVILKDMETCVKEAYRIAESGYTVLLSPACASWDMYNSFEERGKDFKNCVRELRK